MIVRNIYIVETIIVIYIEKIVYYGIIHLK